MTKQSNLTRAVKLRMSDGTEIGTVIWAWGICSVVTVVESHREPRLDSTNSLAIDQFVWAIKNHDPAGTLEFLWDEYLAAS